MRKHSKLINKLLKHFNQVELAKKLGCSQGKISNYKNDLIEDCSTKFMDKMVKLETKLKGDKNDHTK